MSATPEQVIEAVRSALSANRHDHDLVTVAWEKGTTAVVVFSWDFTQVVRYVMSDDLTTVVGSETVKNRRRKP